MAQITQHDDFELVEEFNTIGVTDFNLNNEILNNNKMSEDTNFNETGAPSEVELSTSEVAGVKCRGDRGKCK